MNKPCGDNCWAGFEQQCGDRELCALLPNPLSLGLWRVGSWEGGRVRLAGSVGLEGARVKGSP